MIEHAERIGEDANHLAEEFIAEGLSGNYLVDDPDDLTDEQVSEIRGGIKRRLEAAATRRVKPIRQVVSKARQRHGFPLTWAGSVEA